MTRLNYWFFFFFFVWKIKLLGWVQDFVIQIPVKSIKWLPLSTTCAAKKLFIRYLDQFIVWSKQRGNSTLNKKWKQPPTLFSMPSFQSLPLIFHLFPSYVLKLPILLLLHSHFTPLLRACTCKALASKQGNRGILELYMLLRLKALQQMLQKDGFLNLLVSELSLSILLYKIDV